MILEATLNVFRDIFHADDAVSRRRPSSQSRVPTSPQPEHDYTGLLHKNQK